MRLLCLAAIASLMFAGLGLAPVADPPAKDDATISDVMNDVMKGGLLRKAMSGSASDEEKMKVLDMFISLAESDAPQGDADEWRAMTQKVLTDYAKVLVGREDAGKALRASTNCKACHDKFKP